MDYLLMGALAALAALAWSLYLEVLKIKEATQKMASQMSNIQDQIANVNEQASHAANAIDLVRIDMKESAKA